MRNSPPDGDKDSPSGMEILGIDENRVPPPGVYAKIFPWPYSDELVRAWFCGRCGSGFLNTSGAASHANTCDQSPFVRASRLRDEKEAPAASERELREGEL